MRAPRACALCLQFIQWNIHKSGLKVSEYSLPADATGPFVLSGYSGYKQVQVPRGRLFAFDSEGNYMLTCSATGGIIYKVPGGVGAAGRVLPGGLSSGLLSQPSGHGEASDPRATVLRPPGGRWEWGRVRPAGALCSSIAVLQPDSAPLLPPFLRNDTNYKTHPLGEGLWVGLRGTPPDR